MIVFGALPGSAATVDAWDAAEPGEYGRYSCTGDRARRGSTDIAAFLAGWAPGGSGDVPDGTGQLVKRLG